MIYALTATGVGTDLEPVVAAIACMILAAAFIAIELQLNGNPRRPPILDLGVFLMPTRSGAAIVAATMAFANFGLTFYIMIFFANVLHDPPFVVGLKLLSITGSSVVASSVAGKLLESVPACRLLVAAMALIVVGDTLLAVAISPSA